MNGQLLLACKDVRRPTNSSLFSIETGYAVEFPAKELTMKITCLIQRRRNDVEDQSQPPE
jgi:hypothetical protein